MSTTGGQDPATYDVVVVGGGAGLSGALTLGRSRRSVWVVDGGEACERVPGAFAVTIRGRAADLRR